MAKLRDLTGKRFGMLTVLHRAQEDYPRVYWTCRCDCGNVIDVAAKDVPIERNMIRTSTAMPGNIPSPISATPMLDAISLEK